ncbi:hypothetical protein AB0H73_19955 [Streptomyces olivoreticuli]
MRPDVGNVGGGEGVDAGCDALTLGVEGIGERRDLGVLGEGDAYAEAFGCPLVEPVQDAAGLVAFEVAPYGRAIRGELVPERHGNERAPTEFGHGGVGVHSGEDRTGDKRGIPGGAQVHTPQSRGDFRGFQQGVRDAAGLDDVAEPVLRRGVLDGEDRRLGEQKISGCGRDVVGERDVQAGVAAAVLRVTHVPPKQRRPSLRRGWSR